MAGGRKTDCSRKDAEFDAYAHRYAAGMENRVKALLGKSSDDFQMVKLNWLLRNFPILASTDGQFRLLDYGCGAAPLLRLMVVWGVRASLAGSDISTRMLAEAARTWPREVAQLPELTKQIGARAAFDDAMFDVVVVSAVLHHVPPKEREAIYSELFRLLRPGGYAVIFEHNPLNPITRFVVARTPIDRNAVLLGPAAVRRGLSSAGFTRPVTSYFMFAPPSLRLLGSRFDAALRWLPLGAQYAVMARKGRLPTFEARWL